MPPVMATRRGRGTLSLVGLELCFGCRVRLRERLLVGDGAAGGDCEILGRVRGRARLFGLVGVLSFAFHLETRRLVLRGALRLGLLLSDGLVLAEHVLREA